MAATCLCAIIIDISFSVGFIVGVLSERFSLFIIFTISGTVALFTRYKPSVLKTGRFDWEQSQLHS